MDRDAELAAAQPSGAAAKGSEGGSCEDVLFPSHVVTGKTLVALFQEAALLAPTGELLKPGTKVKSLSECGTAVELNAGFGRHGWADSSRLHAIPEVQALGPCRCCGRTLPSGHFSRAAGGLLRRGEPASCRKCEGAATAAILESALFDPLVESAKAVSGADAAEWAAFIATGAGSLVAAAEPQRLVVASVVWTTTVAAAIAWFAWARLAAETSGQEASLEERPLRLVSDGSRRAWEACIHEEATRSFASLLRNPFPREQLQAWRSAARSMTSWQQPPARSGGVLPRQAAWFVRRGCKCSYEYGGTFWTAEEMPPWLLEVEAAVWDLLAGAHSEAGPLEAPNSCVLNYYEDGQNFVDWHADDEPVFEGLSRDCRIVSLSLGAARQFELRRRRLFGPKREHVSVELSDGDVITMEGLFQKHWQHRVPRRAGVAGPRVNLTWRTITAHRAVDGCPFAAA